MTITEQIKARPLKDIIEAAGTTLRRIGNRHEGLCPLHPDKTPSLVVYEDNHYKCYGCNSYGDAVDFIQGLYGYDFKQALKHLGITTGKMTGEMRLKIRIALRNRGLKEKREQRIRDLIHTLGLLIRTTRHAMTRLTPYNFNDQCLILDPLPWWEYCFDTLVYGSEDDKSEALAELRNFNTISRNPLFKPEFNFRAWLRSLNNAAIEQN